jgi:membrane protease YdiL (CAAX protease family)
MQPIKAFVARHPIAAYFTLTFTLSWGGVLSTIAGPAGMTGVKAQDHPLFPFAVVAMLAGPSLASLVLTRLIDGTSGLRDLRARLLNWRASARWYGIALLAAPLLAAGVTLSLSVLSPEFLPAVVVADDRAAVVLFGLVVALAAGFFEELGWTGFAIPRLRRQHSSLATGLIVGVIWSAWHVLAVAWGIGDRAGSIPIATFMLVDGLAVLPAFRVLMVWIYDRTGSLFVGILMHTSLTATTLILSPQTVGLPLLAYGVSLAAALWIVIAMVSVNDDHRRSRQPWERRAA